MVEYIKRSAAVSTLISVENRYNRNRDHENVSAEALYKDLCDAEIEIGKIPSAEVAQVVHSRWLKNERFKQKRRKCSECGLDSDFEYNFCPNCGAKMDLD